MAMFTVIILACLQVSVSFADKSHAAATAVYGFSGAAAAVTSGRTLHYTVHLKKCRQLSGPADPEFTETFGGHTTSWRTFNDRETAPIPYMTFYDQKTVYNNTGHLGQLSREILIWGNDTTFVTTIIYSPDYSQETYTYSHECSMSTATTKGNIDLFGSSNMPTPLNTFESILDELETNSGVHFTAMTFLCQGGTEHTFSTFGGIINNYDIVYDDDALVEIKTSIGQTAHFDAKYNIGVLDVINLRLFNNRTIDIYDNVGVPPEMRRVAVRRSTCFMATGVPGGMVHLYGKGSSTPGVY